MNREDVKTQKHEVVVSRIGAIFAGEGWRVAFTWGIGAAILHRVALTVWMAIVWSAAAPSLSPDARIDFHVTPSVNIPTLEPGIERLTFGTFRRWDAVHYLDLAVNGYRADHPGPTVFGALTPYAIRAADAVLPGGVDLASAILQTGLFAVALAILYRLCVVVYRQPAIAPWSVIVLTLTPLSHFFAAPMSESAYLMGALLCFYAAARGRWALAGAAGALATLARSQGVILLGVGVVIALEAYWAARGESRWRDTFGDGCAVRLRSVGGFSRHLPRLAPLLLIPATFIAFESARTAIGLPSIREIYSTISYNYFTDPLSGLITNLRWLAENPIAALTSPDLPALLLTIVLVVIALMRPSHRRPALLAYTIGHMALFVSRINYYYGTDQVTFTQSYARYALILFPLTVLTADFLANARPLMRTLVIAVLLFGSLGGAALYVFALTGP